MSDTHLESKTPWGLGRKMIALVGTAVLVTGVVVLVWTYQGFHSALTRQTLNQVGADALVASVKLASEIDRVGADVEFLSGTPPIQGMIRTQKAGGIDPVDGSTKTLWQERLGTIFTEMLQAKPQYLQIRYIGMANNGLELVRADRVGEKIQTVNPLHLQPKGQRVYFREALSQPPRTLYFSPINLNRENNQVVEPYIPVLRVARPIYSEAEGTPFGILIINLDMRHIFQALGGSLQPTQTLYVTNDQGEFLVHPDPQKTFGSELGRPFGLQDQFPKTAARFVSLSLQSDPIVQEEDEFQQVVGMHKSQYDPRNPSRFLGVIVEDSFEHVIAPAITTRNQTIVISLFLLGGALLVALLVARTLTRPLKHIAEATEAFGRGESDIRLRITSHDEVGQLAHSFNSMATQVEERTALVTLESEVDSALNTANDKTTMLQACIDAIAQNLKNAVVRIWTVDTLNQNLELEAGDFLSPHREDPYRRLPIGQSKFAQIALERKPLIIHGINNNSRVPDQEWATNEQIQTFAGYPLHIENREIGAIGIYSRRPLSDLALAALEHVANRMSLGIDRFQKEETSRNLSNRLVLATTATHIGIWDWDVLNNVLIWDDQMYTLYGMTSQDFSGAYEAWVKAVHPDDLERGNEEIQQALKGKKPFDTEFRVVWPDQSVHWIEAHAVVERDKQGNAIRMTGVNWDITERKHAESELRRRQERFLQIIEASPSGILMINHLGTIVLINQKISELFGYATEELVGQPIEMLVPDRFRSHHPQKRENFFANPESRKMGAGRDLFGLRKDGTEFPLEIGLSPIETPLGTHAIATIIDISERQQAAKVIQEREKRMRLIIEAAPNGIIMVDTKGQMVLVNSQTEQLFGYSRDEMIGQSIEQLIPDRFRSDHFLHRNEFIAAPSNKRMAQGRKLFALQKNGTEFPVEIGLNSINTPEGLMILATIVDLTEIEKSHEAIAQLHRRNELLLASAGEGIYGLDMKGNTTFVNPAAANMLGYTPDELIGVSMHATIHHTKPDGSPYPREESPMNAAFQDGLVHHVDNEVLWRKDGTSFPVEYTSTPMHDEHGRIIGAVVTFSDITQRKEVEEALQQWTQALERSNKELDDFAYIASHDLKEPLRGIHNYARFLTEDYAKLLGDEGNEQCQTIMRLSQRMEDLINTLLYYSRTGRTELAIGDVDLDKVVSEVLDTLKPRLEEEGVTIRYPTPLPTLRCDEARVAEIFRNLLTNAMKYNDKAEKWIEIGYVTPKDEPVAFYVRDNGIGIPEKHQDNIFRIFKRLHGRNKFGGGTGAGLTIIKKMIERHGGTIWVESTVGEGTTFWFMLEPFHKSSTFAPMQTTPAQTHS